MTTEPNALDHTRAALPNVFDYDIAKDSVIDAAIRLVDSAPWLGSKRGTVVDEVAYTRLAASVKKLRDMPTGALAGRRWR